MRYNSLFQKTYELPSPGYPHTGTAYMVAVYRQNNVGGKVVDMRLGYGFGYLFKVLSELSPKVTGIASYSYSGATCALSPEPDFIRYLTKRNIDA